MAAAAALSTTTQSEAESDTSTSHNESTIYHTANDLSILQTRDAYIDANLTTILHTTPKTQTYLDTTPNTQRSMTDAQLIARQQQRIDALTQENAAWIDQYHHATQQNTAQHHYIDTLQQQLDGKSGSGNSGGLDVRSNSLYRALLSENAALLARVDSLQRRCRVQEGMIDTRNAAVREMQRICAQQQQQMRQANRRTAPQLNSAAAAVVADKQLLPQEEEKRREDDVDVAATPIDHSIHHSRQSSTASTMSERSVELEQAEALLDAVLMRPPRIFVPTSATSSVASTTPSSPKEERKQLDNSAGSGSSPSRVLPGKPSVLSRRIGKPPLTVQSAKLQRPVVSTMTTRISPRSPVPRSPLSSASASATSATTVPSRTRSSSAAAATVSGATKSGLRAGSGLGKSLTLSPSLSPVPSSPRSPFSLSSTSSRLSSTARVPVSPIPRSPVMTRESSGSRAAVGKVLRPSTASASSTSTSSGGASPTSSAATTTTATAAGPVTRVRPSSASAAITSHSAQPTASVKSASATKASSQNTLSKPTTKV